MQKLANNNGLSKLPDTSEKKPNGKKNWLTKKLKDMLICNEWIHELEDRTKVISDSRAYIYYEMVNSMEGRITRFKVDSESQRERKRRLGVRQRSIYCWGFFK